MGVGGETFRTTELELFDERPLTPKPKDGLPDGRKRGGSHRHNGRLKTREDKANNKRSKRLKKEPFRQRDPSSGGGERRIRSNLVDKNGRKHWKISRDLRGPRAGGESDAPHP